MRSPAGRAGAARVAASLVALAAAGCGGLSDQPGDDREPRAKERVRTVERTRVRVIERVGGGGAFDPAAIYRRYAPGVVTVISTFEEGVPTAKGDGEAGLGSGFVLDEQGFVATNAHVVTTGEPPDIERAEEVYVELADGNRVRARIVGDDPNSDVALLRIDPEGLSLTPLELGSSRRLTVGEPVAAIGSPFGERQSLSIGVISALDREIESLTDFRIGNAIQTDAAINRGNSGGPLLNARGEVIGINSQIKSTSGGGEGVGFAVPVTTVRRSLGQLRRRGKVAYAFLGVTSQQLYPELAEHLGLPAGSGALVVKVQRGSPADRAGIAAGKERTEFQGQRDIPRGGDVILRVGRRRLRGPDDLADLISLRTPGEVVRLVVLRGRKRRAVPVKLAPRPSRPLRG